MSEIGRFTAENFISLCDQLALQDKDFQEIIQQYGYPPQWRREPSFATLIHIILEQQVSLASAKAAFDQLRSCIGDITPENVLRLSDEEMRACYFSRQKASYARGLAAAIINNELIIEKLVSQNDEAIRVQLKKVKGIGDWTVDVFLMMCLHSADIFPYGDIAAVNSLKYIKQISSQVTKEELVRIVEPWKPYRSVAAYLLWHAYICRKGIVYPSA